MIVLNNSIHNFTIGFKHGVKNRCGGNGEASVKRWPQFENCEKINKNN